MSQRNNNNNNNNNYILGSSSSALDDGTNRAGDQTPNSCKNCGFTTCLFSLFQLHVQTCSSGRSRNSRSRQHGPVAVAPVQPSVSSRNGTAGGSRTFTQAVPTASVTDRVVFSTQPISSGPSASLSTRKAAAFPHGYPAIQTSSSLTTVQTSSSSTSVDSASDYSTVANASASEASGGKLPAPTVCRNYKCAKCAFVSNRAKKFLFHQKDVHGENIAVYGCNECEYASRHKNKVIRHKRLVHKMASSPEDIKSLDESPSAVAASCGTATSVIGSLPEVTQAESRPVPSVLSGSSDKKEVKRVFGKSLSSVERQSSNEVEYNIPVSYNNGLTGSQPSGVPQGCSTPLSVNPSKMLNFSSDAQASFSSSTKSDVGVNFNAATRLQTDPNIDDLTLSSDAPPRSPGSDDVDVESQDGSFTGAYESKADFLDGTFRCKQCRYSNPHKWKIVSHIRSSHSKRTIFKCPFCEFITERKIDWCAHKTMHSGKMIFSCKECAYQTTMKRNYERHHERHLMNGPRRCSLCTYSSTGEGAIQRHMAEYHPPSPGKETSASLSACNEELLTSQAVMYPQQSVASAESSFIKEAPEEATLNLSNPAQKLGHQQTMQPMPSRRLSFLQAQQNSSTQESPIVKTDLSMEVQFPVPNGEQLSHSTSNAERSTTKASTPSGDTDALCRICGLVLRSEAKLRIHLIAHSSNARWTCVMCPLRYKRPADLNRHMKRKHDVSLKDVRGKVTTTAVVGINSTAKLSYGGAVNSNLSVAHRVPSATMFSSSYMLAADGEDHDEAPLNLSLKPSSPSSSHRSRKSIGVVSPTQSEPLDLTVSTTTRPRTSVEDFDTKMKCNHCAYVSRRQSDLRRHALVHCSERRYRCAQCGKSYKLQFDLTRHLNRAHCRPPASTRPQDPVVGFNPESETDSKSNGSLTGIIAMPKISSPLLRELSFDDASPPNFKHFQIINNNSSATVAPKIKPGNYTPGLGCTHCEYIAKYPADLERHAKIHVVQTPRRCRFCSYRTVWKGDMKHHYVKHHGSAIGSHGDLRDLVEQTFCREKSEISSVSGNVVGGHGNEADFLDCNMNIHQRGENTFAAVKTTTNNNNSICAWANNRNTAASNVKLYHCPLCSFVSDVPSKVKSHLEIHENLKRFVCTICGKRSNWMWNVRKHIRKRHPGSDLTIRELSETDAKNTLDAYMAQRQGRASNDAERDCVAAWIGATSEKSEPPQPRNEEKKLSYEIESLAEQYANDVAAMFYGNTGGCREMGGSGGPFQVQAPPSGDCSMEMFNELSASRGAAAVKRKAVRVASAAAKRFRPYKCSQCGRRSNWRWDLNKHIRASHPSAHLVELTGTEARETFHEVLHREVKEKSTAATVVGTDAKVKDASSSAWKHWHKPYQCTACGHRSNWKCDLNKHIRALHPTAGVVTLDEAYAKETLAEYDRTHATSKPQRYKALNVEGRHLEKSKSIPMTPTSSAPSMTKLPVEPMISYTVDSLKLKRFQCSACPYRSNFRSDVGRHIRHKHDKAVSRIVVLTQMEASATLKEYLDRWARKKFVPSPSKRRGACEILSIPESQKSLAQSTNSCVAKPIESSAPVGKYLLKCKLCEFVSDAEEKCSIHWQKNHLEAVADESVRKNVFEFDSEFEKIAVQEYTDPPKEDALTEQNNISLSGECVEISTSRIILSCETCPYQTSKPGLMEIHRSYHKPQTGNKLKCTHCPYYVNTPRLLHQHARLHAKTNESEIVKNEDGGRLNLDALVDVDSKERRIICARRKSGRTRYFCGMCPYISCNRNDYLYHRQFHRSRPLSTSYKCDRCSYWVSQKRLLTQHVKVHTPTYEERRAKYVAQSAAGAGGNSVVNTDSEPMEGETQDAESCDSMLSASSLGNDDSSEKLITPEQIDHREGAVNKIDKDSSNSGNISSAQINGSSIASGRHSGRSTPNTTIATTSGNYENAVTLDAFPDIGRLYNGTKRLYCCDRCPYTNPRRDHLTCHMRFHVTKSELRCHYCDYSVSRVHLLNQHVRVHSAAAASNATASTGAATGRGGANPAESFTEIVHMTRRRKRLENGRSTDMEMCSKVELEEMCWLVNIFRETGNFDKGGVATTDEKPTVDFQASNSENNCQPMEKMLKRVYMSFLELKPMSDSESESVSNSDSEAGSFETPPKRRRKCKDSTKV